MYVTRTIIHGGDHLHTAPPPLDRQTPRPRGLSLEIFHIRNALGSRLTQAIQVECIGGFDLIIFTETKINDQDYCLNIMVYYVMCLQDITMAAGNVQGGVGLVVRDQPQGWSIESTHFQGMNVVIYEVFTVKFILLIGSYLPPSTLEHLPELEEALTLFCYQEPIVLGDLNANIQEQNPHSQQVADLLM